MQKKDETCQHLKSEYNHIPSNRAEFKDPATQYYWCMKTMEVTGPDQYLAAPGECSAARTCFVANKNPK